MKKLNQTWNRLSFRLVAVSLVMLFLVSSCQQDEDIAPADIQALEEFESGQESEYILTPQDYLIKKVEDSDFSAVENGYYGVERKENGEVIIYDADGNVLPVTEAETFGNGGFLQNGLLLCTMYNALTQSGSSYSLWMHNTSSTNTEYYWTLPWKPLSWIGRGNTKFRWRVTDSGTTTDYIVDRQNKGAVRDSNTGSWTNFKTVDRVYMTAYDKDDAVAILHTHNNYTGSIRPLWGSGSVTLGTHWKNNVSSVEVNRTDYPTDDIGVVLDSDVLLNAAGQPATETRAIAVFQKWSSLPSELNDHIIKILLGKKFAKTCNPRSTCYRQGGCSGPTISTYETIFGHDENIDSPYRCRSGLAQRGYTTGSYCTQNGRCISPFTLHGEL